VIRRLWRWLRGNRNPEVALKNMEAQREMLEAKRRAAIEIGKFPNYPPGGPF
jgi:hypothetical protein